MIIDDFMLRAALAAVGAAVIAAVLGCFVVWRRMAYFGDATAHAAVLGVALAFALSGPVSLGVLVAALAMAAMIHGLSGRGHTVDTLLGVLAHGALASGLVAVALLPGPRVDLEAYLFGDVLTVTRGDIALIWTAAALIGGALWWRWSDLLTATLSPDLARAAGIDPGRMQFMLTMMIAGLVAVAIKVVGALLITALLIVPAAAARNLARTPEMMAAAAAILGIGAALSGLVLAFVLDAPAGPAIVCAAVLFFALSALRGKSLSIGR